LYVPFSCSGFDIYTVSFVSHGCTGKGNDQVRFELAFYGLKPGIKVVAPWRIPGTPIIFLFCAVPHNACSSNDTEFYHRFAGRQALLAYAADKQIPVQQTAAKPWSTDENLFHISYEAGILEDPNTTPPADMWKLTSSLEGAPATPESISIEFKAGLPVKVTAGSATHTDPVEIFLVLNSLGRKHGIGRIDIVENRFIGVKSRGCYESPGATILRAAHIDLEGLTLDRNVRALRDQFITVELSRILYNGHFFTPEREFVTSAIPASQRTVNGVVRLKLYRGNVVIEGRSSDEVGCRACYVFIELLTCLTRVYMTKRNHPWTSWEALNRLTLRDSSRSSPFVLKSTSLRALLRVDVQTCLDGQRRTYAGDRVALSRRMCMVLVSEHPHTYILRRSTCTNQTKLGS
jgi:argininosuccinate synthase